MKFLVALFAVVAVASAVSYDAEVPIIRQVADVFPDGYQYAYETGNGIVAEEKGQLSGEGIEVVGQAKWVSPEGEKVEFSYTAGQDGYVPVGSHIPVAPPVPEAIVRALEYIRTHPYTEPQQTGYGKKY